MTKLLVAVLTFAFVSTSQAAELCVNVSDKLIYKSIEGNFDGSVVVTWPQVTVQGKQVALAHEDGWDAAKLVCRMVGKTNVVTVNRGSASELSASIGQDGKLDGLPRHGRDTIHQVLCN